MPGHRAPLDTPPLAIPKHPPRRTLWWFKKVVFSVAVLFFLSVACEIALRLLTPESIQFAVSYNRIHSNSGKRRGLEPNATETLKVTHYDGAEFVHFTLSTDALGIRRPVAISQHPPSISQGQTVVHCIGDSFTMGWGVAAEFAYPARLGEILGPNYNVLNLGVDGFGLIDSIDQSRRIAEVYPPDIILYLFCVNDVDDDIKAERDRRDHSNDLLAGLWRFASRNSYLINMPYAIAFHTLLFSHESQSSSVTSTDNQFYSDANVDDIRKMARYAQPLSPPTELALMDLVRWANQNEARLIVILGGLTNPYAPICMSMTRSCDELEVETMFFFSEQEELRLPKDRHLNERGNELLAKLAAERLIDGYKIDDPQILASRHLVNCKRLLLSKNYTDADRELAAATHLLPEDPRALLLRSQLQLAQNNTVDATRHLEEYLDSWPTDLNGLQAWLDLHIRIQFPAGARRRLLRSHEMKPQDISILSLLIKLDLKLDDKDSLTRHLQTLLKIDPENEQAQSMFTQISLSAGN